VIGGTDGGDLHGRASQVDEHLAGDALALRLRLLRKGQLQVPESQPAGLAERVVGEGAAPATQAKRRAERDQGDEAQERDQDHRADGALEPLSERDRHARSEIPRRSADDKPTTCPSPA
jgi:hypothetical protein